VETAAAAAAAAAAAPVAPTESRIAAAASSAYRPVSSPADHCRSSTMAPNWNSAAVRQEAG
jgi:hypothetical protein